MILTFVCMSLPTSSSIMLQGGYMSLKTCVVRGDNSHELVRSLKNAHMPEVGR